MFMLTDTRQASLLAKNTRQASLLAKKQIRPSSHRGDTHRDEQRRYSKTYKEN